jgi:hypothetical protein
VEPRFLNHAGQAERVELVGSFGAATVVATVDVEGILHGGG